MHELLPGIDTWRGQGKGVALATLVKVYGSAPQPVGARMAVSSAGEMAGSVSGGCVEGAVVQEALAVLQGAPPRLVSYGIADELAQSVGLACGGVIDVFVEAMDDISVAFEQAVREARLVALATVLDGPQIGARLLLWPDGASMGTLGDATLDAAMRVRAADLLAALHSERITFSTAHGTAGVFAAVEAPPPKLVIVGAVHIAVALVTCGKTLGYHTVVVDPRTAFATPARFPHADRLIAGWPDAVLPTVGIDEATCVVVLTHDEKIDDPALAYACRSPARYIGALGSRRTHAARVERLQQAGLCAGEIGRIHAPIGLAIGARRPEEIALAIMAEIVATKNLE
jgi:xanthine dehydrogenase accessory factor